MAIRSATLRAGRRLGAMGPGLVHGMCATLLCVLIVYGRAEDRTFRRIATKALGRPTPRTAADSLRALATAVSQLTQVGNRYTNTTLAGVGLRETVLPSADFHLMGAGGCGAASIVMVRLLDEVAIPARILQMRCGSEWGCHIVVEAKVGGKWVVVDPWFNMVYQLPSGALLSAAELKTQWLHFADQLPNNYIPKYRYEAVRYTNWDKFPAVGPFIHDMALRAGLSRIDSVSVGAAMANRYTPLEWLTALSWVGFAIVSLKVRRQVAQPLVE